MKAAVIHKHGGLEEIVYQDFLDPEMAAGEVLVGIRAVALNHLDIFTLRGMPGIKVPLPMIGGGDMAGEIVEVGAKVGGWKPGDRVMVDPINRKEGGMMGETIPGGLAELARVPAHQLLALPDGVGFEAAAALPVAYGAAHRMVVTRGKIEAGEKVLVLGASGGVGTATVLLCKLRGAHVTACSGAANKLAKLKALGADEVIDVARDDLVDEVIRLHGKPRYRGGAGGVDVVVNFTGGESWARSLRTLRRHGRMLTCGATAGYDPSTDIRYIWSYELDIVGSNGWTTADLTRLLELVSEGRLKPVIDRVMPLSQAREALGMLERREVFGKLLLRP